MAKRRQHRTPHSGGLDPFYTVAIGFVAVAAGIHFVRKGKTTEVLVPATVNGFGSSFKKAVGKAKSVGRTVSRIDPSMRIARKVVGVAMKSPAAKGLNKLISKTPLGPMTAKISVGGSAMMRMPKTKPGQQVEYQDENGNIITKAQFNARQRMYDQQANCDKKVGYEWNGGACTKLPSTGTPRPASSGGGGGGGNSSSGGGSSWLEQAASMAPAAVQMAQGAGVPSSITDAASSFFPSSGGGGGAAAPASEPEQVAVAQAEPEKKASTLMTILAFAAVPVVMAVTGKK